ncbi:hypothetical protein DUI87_10752 [Hirundo rustica rustica]|uniref:Uncharacterized protein n=1 Tax=Hirundo rustica rustica TaxID=333673 RepID=A0A3M0KIZ7_HIRRU|nr:hypothetical protein DUI87_10752 [Hirundo rustica rustica]
MLLFGYEPSIKRIMDSTMKLKESQLIILIVLPIYTMTEQSKVANTQISLESYATGKNIPETKKHDRYIAMIIRSIESELMYNRLCWFSMDSKKQLVTGFEIDNRMN